MPKRKPNKIDDQRILNALRLLVRELRTSSLAAERKTGLSGAQLFVLRALIAEPGMSVNALSRHTLTHQSSVSVVVTKLTRSGFIERVRSLEDRRTLILRATTAGRALVATGPDPIQERLLMGLSQLTPSLRQHLARGLTQWTKAAGLADEAPPMFFESSPDV